MANKIRNVKVIYEDGRVSESIPVGAKAMNVDMENGHTIEYELSKAVDDINTFEGKIKKETLLF